MRRIRRAAALIAALAVAPSAAHAAKGIDAQPNAGPVIALGHVVWGEAPGDADLRLHAANQTGRTAVIVGHPSPGEGWRQYFPTFEANLSVFDANLAGSQSRIAYIRQGNNTTDQTSGEYFNELWTVSGSGRGLLDDRCSANSVDLDGDTIAWSFLNECDGSQIVVRNLASETEARLPPPQGGASEVKLAGRYLAWSEKAFWETPERHEVVVYDWVADAPAYRVNVAPLIPPNHPFGYEWHYDLQADGKLVMAYKRIGYFESAKVSWFSPGEPSAHEIPVQLHTPLVSIAGDLVGGCRVDPPEAAVFDLQGRVVDHLDAIDPGWYCRVAFDGEQVAWLNGARKPALYFDDFPASEPEIPPLVAKPEAQTVRPRATGAVTLGEQDVDCTGFVSSRCSVRTILRAAKTGAADATREVIGRFRYRVRAGRAKPLKVRLTRAGRRLAGRSNKLRTRMSVAVESPLGDRATDKFRVTLLSPRR